MKKEGEIWFLPDDKSLNAAGPFTTEKIKEMLKNDELQIDSCIFSEEFRASGWKRVFEIPEFAEFLRRPPICPVPKLYSRGHAQGIAPKLNFEEMSGTFGVGNTYRRFPRAPLSCACFVNDQNRLFYGRIVDISEMGASVVFPEKVDFREGAVLTLTARAPAPMGTFSVRLVVVRRSQEGGGEVYGFYFLQLNPGHKRKIARYVLNELTKISKGEKSA